jgi:predicted ester cyclase
MTKELENKAIAARWLDGFWGQAWTPNIVDDLAAADILLQFSLQIPCRGREDAKKFLIGIHEAFPDLEFHSAADLVADGDHVVCRLEGGGTHTGPTFIDCLIGFLSANSGRKAHFSGTTVLRIENGEVAEEMTRITWATERSGIEKIAA